MRRLAMALGLIAVTVGGWTLHHVRSQQATCVPHTAGSAGFGVSTSCLNQVGAEYISLGVIVVGIFVFLGALLLLNRERMTRRTKADLEHRLVGTPGQRQETNEQFAKYDGRSGTASATPPQGDDPALRGYVQEEPHQAGPTDGTTEPADHPD